MVLILQRKALLLRKFHFDAARIIKICCRKLRECSLIMAGDPHGVLFSALVCRRHRNAIPREQIAIVATIASLGQVLSTDWCTNKFVFV